MPREQNLSLQPLRLSLGWKIAWNSFYELDPPSDPEATGWIMLGEDLLLLQNQRVRIVIDVSWMPWGPKGRFVLSAVDWLSDEEMPEEWTRPLLQFRSRSRAAIVARLDRWTGEEFDWGAVRRRRRHKSKVPLETSYVRNQKLYESVD